MNQPLRESDYFTPPPQTRPYGAPTGSAVQTAVSDPALGSQQLAGAGRRLVARIIDGAIVSVIAIPFSAAMLSDLLAHLNDKVKLATASGGQVSLTDPTTIRLTLLLTAIVLTLSFVYEVPQLTRWGQTLGKRICRIRVVRIDGAPRLGLLAAIRRWLVQAGAPQLPWIGVGIWLLDSLWLLWDKPLRQCLHDKLARTIVVTVHR